MPARQRRRGESHSGMQNLVSSRKCRFDSDHPHQLRTIRGHRRVGGIVYERDVLTLPRSGSRVRIPSPAPIFFKQISESERSFGVVFCFPASDTTAGEAGGKQTGAKRGGLLFAFLRCSLFKPRSVSKIRRDRSGWARPQTSALDASVRRSRAFRSMKSLIGVSMRKPNLCVRSR